MSLEQRFDTIEQVNDILEGLLNVVQTEATEYESDEMQAFLFGLERTIELYCDDFLDNADRRIDNYHEIVGGL